MFSAKTPKLTTLKFSVFKHRGVVGPKGGQDPAGVAGVWGLCEKMERLTSWGLWSVVTTQATLIRGPGAPAVRVPKTDQHHLAFRVASGFPPHVMGWSSHDAPGSRRGTQASSFNGKKVKE